MKVLDFGYVNLVESWGSDERIIEAARMSTDKGFNKWEDSWVCQECRCSFCIDMGTCRACGGGLKLAKGDMHLLSYLWIHQHHTPFEQVGFTVEVQAPIMVFREWHRHRTQSYNEMSGRYTTLPDLYYIPSTERLMAGKQSKSNKQSSEEGFTEKQAFDLRADIIYQTEQSRKMYETLLARGVSRELARLVLPVNQYSRMRASANLRNWLGFLRLRLDKAAQWEIREYSKAVGQLVAEHFPRTWSLFCETSPHLIT